MSEIKHQRSAVANRNMKSNQRGWHERLTSKSRTGHTDKFREGFDCVQNCVPACDGDFRIVKALSS